MIVRRTMLCILFSLFFYGSLYGQQFVEEADAVVILGKQLNKEGTMQHELYERLYWGMQPYLEGKAKMIIVSGGSVRGKANISEAEAMKDFLIFSGVKAGDILMEKKSASTVENALFVSRMILERKMKKIYLCSSPYHMNRSWDNPTVLFREQLQSSTEVIPIPDFPAIRECTLTAGYDPALPLELTITLGKPALREAQNRFKKSGATVNRLLIALPYRFSVNRDSALLEEQLQLISKIYRSPGDTFDIHLFKGKKALAPEEIGLK